MTKSDESRPLKDRTKLVHAGRHPFDQYGFVNTPVYRGSTVLYRSYADLVARNAKYTYGTHGTPTTEALETAWTEITGAAGTVLAPSGLSAVALALLTVVKAGDHILVSDSVYQPTRSFCERFLNADRRRNDLLRSLARRGNRTLIRPNTSVIFLETPGSQTFEIQDVPAIVAVAAAKGLCTILDNTWATPLFFQAHGFGVDLVVEAGTKYLSGHADLLLGLVSANARWFPRLHATFDLFANCPGPEDVFLALRGLRSLELRLREAERQGLALATWLVERPEVARVLHPALPDCPGHAIWKRDFRGSSGLFSAFLKPSPKRRSPPFSTG